MDDIKNSEKTLSHFANEVLSLGPMAVLPQNLPYYWLKEIQKMADEFLDANFKSKTCGEAGDASNPILAACVYEICKGNGDGNNQGAKLSKKMFIRYATIYSISVTMETVRRESGIEMELPTLENIFSEQRMERLKEGAPELADFFKRVCLEEQ